MWRSLRCLLVLGCLVPAGAKRGWATDLGQMQGVVHDAQHRPVAGARVEVRAVGSEVAIAVETDAEGGFRVPPAALGRYTITVTAAGFRGLEQEVTLAAATSPMLHLQLEVGRVTETVTVMAREQRATVETVTPTTLVSRAEIAETPGADRTNGLEAITDVVPGAYVTHDQLHLRGGHQVSWLIDGVEIPNTNIASNLGAQIDPKDVAYLEVERGSYEAGVGDRTYGVFDVVPRSGFDRSREGEVVATAGSFGQTNDQVNMGSHTERAAYYASVNGNRSGYGLSTPVETVLHDTAFGYGGFGSVLYNRSPEDQFRLVTQLRTDRFQIPYDPDPRSAENQMYDSSGLRDAQHETDGLVAGTWARTMSGTDSGRTTLVEVSPFYHSNRAAYEPSVGDLPVATTSERTSQYGGLQASVTQTVRRNTVEAGIYGFGQHDRYAYGSVFNDGSFANFLVRETATGGVVEGFVSDSYKPAEWLMLTAGVRATHFAGAFAEDVVAPRFGAAVRVPRLGWVFRGFYGRFYQPPPLETAAGPIVAYANSQNTAFAPLHGERDEEHQIGMQIPLGGWLVDADTFRTRANNFLDHSNLGESSLYYPVTIDGALIRGWELTLTSPRMWRGGRAHLAYSNQIAEQRGAITGGLVCFPAGSAACDAGFVYVPLDHDQRNTLSAGYSTALPWRVTASTTVAYGSGFTNGSPSAQYPGAYLPAHTSWDLTVGRALGERTTISVSGLNVLDQRRLLDNSLTFGGFHTSDPRQVYGEVRWRFGY